VDCCIEKIPLPIQMLKIFAETLFFSSVVVVVVVGILILWVDG
jgi:hypothetical protein